MIGNLLIYCTYIIPAHKLYFCVNKYLAMKLIGGTITLYVYIYIYIYIYLKIRRKKTNQCYIYIGKRDNNYIYPP